MQQQQRILWSGERERASDEISADEVGTRREEGAVRDCRES
jgi:hypothetical protein